MGPRRKDRRGVRTPARAPAAGVPPDRARRSAIRLRAAFIVFAGIIAYANGLSGPFVLDDQDTVVLNEQIRSFSPSVVLFPARELPVAGRPVVNLSFAVNYAAGGLAVRGYHIVNVAIHIACGLLLFGIVRRTFTSKALRDAFESRSTDLAFAAALIWLVHPLQTDAVDYVTQRTELMMGFFYLLTLYAGVRGYENSRWQIVAFVSCALGMASKESMVTAPLMVLVYDRVFVFDTFGDAWRRRGRFYAALAGTWLLLAALIWSGPRFRSAGFSSGVTPWVYLLNQTVMIVRYLRLAIWPTSLVVDYGTPRPLGVADVLPYAAVVLALAAATVWALRYHPRIGFLGAWFFTTLSPTSSLVPIGTEVGAERRMYLPLAAVVLLAITGMAWLLQHKAPRRGHVIGLATVAAVAIACAAGTIVRNREYASPITLAQTTLDRWPTDRARHSLGVALVENQQYAAGIEQLRQAVAGDPSARYTLGVALYKQGRLDEAVAELRAFLAHDSTRIEVPTAHELMGRALMARGRFDEAAEEFRQVLTMTPSNADAHRALAECLLRQQHFDEAITHYRQFLARRPDEVSALMQLGIAYAAVGWRNEAIAQFRRVVELNPRDGRAHGNLAQALLDQGAFAEALPSARQAAALRPDDPLVHHQLGLALTGDGQIDAGIQELRRALALDPANAEIRSHLEVAVERAKETRERRP